jgi:hypothetical protein
VGLEKMNHAEKGRIGAPNFKANERKCTISSKGLQAETWAFLLASFLEKTDTEDSFGSSPSALGEVELQAYGYNDVTWDSGGRARQASLLTPLLESSNRRRRLRVVPKPRDDFEDTQSKARDDRGDDANDVASGRFLPNVHPTLATRTGGRFLSSVFSPSATVV